MIYFEERKNRSSLWQVKQEGLFKLISGHQEELVTSWLMKVVVVLTTLFVIRSSYLYHTAIILTRSNWYQGCWLSPSVIHQMFNKLCFFHDVDYVFQAAPK